MYYNLDGIITVKKPESKFWVKSVGDNFIFKENDKSYELEGACIKLRNKFIAKPYGSLSKYHALLPSIYPILQFGGIDAEINISKTEFEIKKLQLCVSVTFKLCTVTQSNIKKTPSFCAVHLCLVLDWA